LHVPDTDNRYYLMPMLDAWTNIFSSPGKRTTGTQENNFVVTGPFWNGTLPEEVIEIKSPTNLVWIIGRTQTNGSSDYNAVHDIQAKYTLTPLSSYGESYMPPENDVDDSIDMVTPPIDQVKQLDTNSFFNEMAMLMKDNPTSLYDADAVLEFKKIGLVPGEAFDTSTLDKRVAQAINLGAKAAYRKIVSNLVNIGTEVNRWMVAYDTGIYCTNYLLRASVAMRSLGQNIPKDALYFNIYVDSDNNTLNGANKYTIHFEKDQIPPVDAFWSLTMYNMDMFFVDNGINRYAIGDRDQMKFNEDGSLDIYIQCDTPEDTNNESNWLPAPDEDFRLSMRLYWPSQKALDGAWQIPSVQLSGQG